jgi:CheY-like chemotaxis protein
MEVMSLSESGSVTTTLRILAVGSANSLDAVRDGLLRRDGYRLTIATSNAELNAISIHEKYDVAILDQTLSHSELRNASEYIRRKWPNAKILVICAEPESLDDPLYDERALPDLSANMLLAIIDAVYKT